MTVIELPCPRCQQNVAVPGDTTLVPELPLPGHDCPTPAEAHPPSHRWYVETRDGLADEWSGGIRYRSRDEAAARLHALNAAHPLWRDGTPVQRRLTRETTSYTVEVAGGWVDLLGVLACPGHETCERCDVTDPCPCCNLQYRVGQRVRNDRQPPTAQPGIEIEAQP